MSRSSQHPVDEENNFLLWLLYFPEVLPNLVEHSVCCYQDVSPGTLQNFRLFHALHEICVMICNRLEHGLHHKTNRIETTETQISFD